MVHKKPVYLKKKKKKEKRNLITRKVLQRYFTHQIKSSRTFERNALFSSRTCLSSHGRVISKVDGPSRSTHSCQTIMSVINLVMNTQREINDVEIITKLRDRSE